MEAEYIGFDFETGGIDHLKNPILTGYFCVLDKDLNILGELDLKIKPEAPFNVIEKEALAVNGIDIAKHLEDPATLSREQAAIALAKFLITYKTGKKSPRPLGHNIAFDLAFLSTQLIPQDKLKKVLSYGNICTKGIADFLKMAGLLPPEIGTLESLVKYFKIKQRNAHNAKDDTLMMVEVYGKLLQMVKQTGNAGFSVDVLSMLEK